jgi:SAM-dependent methyltransferase
MVMSRPSDYSPHEKTLPAAGNDPARPGAEIPAKVIWHDLECGTYRADLPFWRKLAERYGAPILDVGAGTGRVALDLARAGHLVTALDLDPDLLGALADRAGQLPVESVCADARSFDLDRCDFALCLVPMQTLQLLGGITERVEFLRCASAHLQPGGLLACAIVTELDQFDTADGSPGPAPETARAAGDLYVSRATGVRVLDRQIVIERLRRIIPGGEIPGGESGPGDEHTGDARAVGSTDERDVIGLARVSTSELEREGLQAGLTPEPALEISPTDEHVGSAVVMLRA